MTDLFQEADRILNTFAFQPFDRCQSLQRNFTYYLEWNSSAMRSTTVEDIDWTVMALKQVLDRIEVRVAIGS